MQGGKGDDGVALPGYDCISWKLTLFNFVDPFRPHPADNEKSMALIRSSDKSTRTACSIGKCREVTESAEGGPRGHGEARGAAGRF